MDRQIGLPVTEEEWIDLVGARQRQLARFLSWAAEREAVESLRLSNRSDVRHVQGILDAFADPRWAAVVYSCFDSEIGTLAVAQAFPHPVDPTEATRRLLRIDLPAGAVRHHRTQPGHTGARTALVSACARARDFERILREGQGFHDRYEALRRLRAKQWGRTTCFDLLVRTGQLGIGSGRSYEPDRAYLADSTGPRNGFRLVWGIAVTRSNAEGCEALLHGWTKRWHRIAEQVGVAWTGEPYGPGDFENALCVFQEPGGAGYQVRCYRISSNGVTTTP
jgi:hypothetical protein